MRSAHRPCLQLSPLAVAVTAMAIVVGGCGSGSHTAPASDTAAIAGLSAQVLAQARREQDGDRDNDSYGLGPLDDDHDADAVGYGRAATPAEWQAIVTTLRRYYLAAAAENAAKVCSLLYPVGVEVLVEQHSHGQGQAWARGGDCEQIAAKILRHEHRRLARQLPALKARVVRVREQRGWVVLDFGSANERWLLMHRVGSRWMLASLDEASV